MATIPGTKFTEIEPTKETGQIPWSPSLASTGGEQAMVAGIEKLGIAVTAYAINTMKQEMAIEFSERKRTIDELGWTARNSVTGDEDADRKLWEKFEQDTQAIAGSSKYKDVNDELTKHINSVSPNWEQGIYISSLNKRRENVKDQFDLEWEALLENGRIPEAIKLAEDNLKLGTITPAKYDNLVETAPTQSRILRAERLIELKNNEAALTELEKLNDKDLTTKQIQQKNILTSTAEKARDSASSALLNDVYGKIAGGMPLSDVGELIKQTVGISEIQRTKLMDAAINADKIWKKEGINRWTQTDEEGYEKIFDLMVDIEKGKVKTNDEINTAFLSGPDGAPAFDFNKMLWAKNLSASYNTPTKGYSPAHEISKTYFSGLESLYVDDEGKIENRKDYVTKRFELEEALKNNWGNPAAMDAEYERITGKRKQEKTKSWLTKWWNKYMSVEGEGVVHRRRRLAKEKEQMFAGDLYEVLIAKHPDKRELILKAKANGWSAEAIAQELK